MRTLLLVAALAALVLCGAAQTLSELANWNGTWYSGCNMQQQPPNVQRPGLDTFENRSYTFSGNDIFIDEWVFPLTEPGDPRCNPLNRGVRVTVNLTVLNLTTTLVTNKRVIGANMTSLILKFDESDYGVATKLGFTLPSVYNCSLDNGSGPFEMMPDGCGQFVAPASACPVRFFEWRIIGSDAVPEGFYMSAPIDLFYNITRGCRVDDPLVLENNVYSRSPFLFGSSALATRVALSGIAALAALALATLL